MDVLHPALEVSHLLSKALDIQCQTAIWHNPCKLIVVVVLSDICTTLCPDAMLRRPGKVLAAGPHRGQSATLAKMLFQDFTIASNLTFPCNHKMAALAN